jgi:hypothetical protein
MPDWLYKYFGDVIQPLISKKSGRSLDKPTIFSETRGHGCVSSSFWVYPSEATILLHNHRFDPTILYHPRFSCGCLIFSSRNSTAHLVSAQSSKRTVLLSHIALLMWITVSTLYPGRTTVRMGANPTFMAGVSHLSSLFRLGCSSLFQQFFHTGVDSHIML